MRRRWIVGLVALFAIGVGLGLLGGIYVFDDDSDARVESAAAVTSTAVDCDEANAIVAQANDTMVTLNEGELQDVNFFAKLIAEQRAITYTMDAAPSCFSLDERARSEGLLDGLRALLSAPIEPTEP